MVQPFSTSVATPKPLSACCCGWSPHKSCGSAHAGPAKPSLPTHPPIASCPNALRAGYPVRPAADSPGSGQPRPDDGDARPARTRAGHAPARSGSAARQWPSRGRNARPVPCWSGLHGWHRKPRAGPGHGPRWGQSADRGEGRRQTWAATGPKCGPCRCHGKPRRIGGAEKSWPAAARHRDRDEQTIPAVHPRRCLPHPKPCTPLSGDAARARVQFLVMISYHKTHLDILHRPEAVSTAPATSIPRQTLPKAGQQDTMNGSVCESSGAPSRHAPPPNDHNAPPVTDQRKPAQTAWPALRVLAAKVLGRLETTTTIPALLPIPVLSLPCAALGATDPIGSGLAWLQSQILSDGQPSRTSALEAPTQARCETAKTLLRLLVSRHRSDVVGCAQPSERSARRIAQPIPSCIGKRCNAA